MERESDTAARTTGVKAENAIDECIDLWVA